MSPLFARCDLDLDGDIDTADRDMAMNHTDAWCTLPAQALAVVYTWDAENRLVGVEPADCRRAGKPSQERAGENQPS